MPAEGLPVQCCQLYLLWGTGCVFSMQPWVSSYLPNTIWFQYHWNCWNILYLDNELSRLSSWDPASYQLPAIRRAGPGHFVTLYRVHKLSGRVHKRGWVLRCQSDSILLHLHCHQLPVLCAEQYLWAMCTGLYRVPGEWQHLYPQLLTNPQLSYPQTGCIRVPIMLGMRTRVCFGI